MLPRMQPLPPPAIALAEQQHGLLARRQLLRFYSKGAVDRARDSGRLITVAPGVYRVAGGAVLPSQTAVATGLRARSPVVITGPWALAWYGAGAVPADAPFRLLTEDRQRLAGLEMISVVADLGRWYADARPLGELHIAGPVDALIDSAGLRASIGDRSLVAALDELRWRGVLSLATVRARLHERGQDDAEVRAFRALFAGTGGLTPESEGERRLAPLLLRLRPAPEPQVWVTPTRRVDWYLRSLRCGWEYLGAVDHARGERRRADAARDAELRQAGVHLTYVTARDLDDPTALLANIMAGLVVRAEQLGLAPPDLRG